MSAYENIWEYMSSYEGIWEYMSSYAISIYLKVCILKKIMIYYECMKKTPYEKGSWSNRLASFFVFKNIK